MYSASEAKKLTAAVKRQRIYILIWGAAAIFAFVRNFNNLPDPNDVDVLRLFSLLFFLLSIEGIYFRYYWRSKRGNRHTIFSEPKPDEVYTWQGKIAVMSGMLYALLGFVLLVWSFG